MDEDRLIDVLEGALGAGILAEVATQPGRYTFSHAVIEHTLVRRSSPPPAARGSTGRSPRRSKAYYVVNVAEHLAELARHLVVGYRTDRGRQGNRLFATRPGASTR